MGDDECVICVVLYVVYCSISCLGVVLMNEVGWWYDEVGKDK